MMILQLKKGFTLVELLIVIAIIGVLSSIVLNALSGARTKAADSKIKQQLVGFRRAAEIFYYNQTPNSYGVTVSNSCSTAGSVFASQSTNDGNPYSYLNTWAGITTPSQITCYSTGSAYAVSISLSSGYWCVDSTNTSKSRNSAITSTAC